MSDVSCYVNDHDISLPFFLNLPKLEMNIVKCGYLLGSVK